MTPSQQQAFDDYNIKEEKLSFLKVPKHIKILFCRRNFAKISLIF